MKLQTTESTWPCTVSKIQYTAPENKLIQYPRLNISWGGIWVINNTVHLEFCHDWVLILSWQGDSWGKLEGVVRDLEEKNFFFLREGENEGIDLLIA